MNICIETHVLNHHRRSGLMTYTEGLVNGISKIDTENQYSMVFYSLSAKSANMPGPQVNNFRKDVLKVPDFEFRGRQCLVDNIALPIFFKRNSTRVFHRTCGHTMPTGKDIFKVLTVHDLRTLTIGDNYYRQHMGNYKKAIDSLDACVVVSENTKKDLIKFLDVDEKKISVVHLGADKRFKPSSEVDIKQLKEKYNLNEPFLLSIGSVPRKNIEGIIRGFAASKANKEFLLVLSCNEDIAKYMQIASDLGVANRIRIFDKITDNEVVVFYSACHAFLFPSLYEGFGLPILEAFQCHAPVITSNISSCPEVAGDAAIMVDPMNHAEIGNAIDEICSNSALRATLIEKGIQRSLFFSWDKHSQEIKKIYMKA